MSFRNKNLDEAPPTIAALYKDAKIAGAWIFDSRTNNWYTPEEFLDQWRTIFAVGGRKGDSRSDFKIMNPIAGEREYKKRMRDAMADYLKFRSKIEEYYNVELVVKKGEK